MFFLAGYFQWQRELYRTIFDPFASFFRRISYVGFLNLVICIICLSGSSVCVWISVYLALFPPTRDLYRISIHSHFVKFLTDAAGFGIWHHLLITKFCVSSNLGFVLVLFPPTRDLYWISVHSRLVRFLTDASGFDILHHLFSISVSLWISAVFCPLSGNKGLTLHFDPFSLSQISYRCFWIWNCIIFFIGDFCLSMNLCFFGPLSSNKELVYTFDPFALSQISYRCFWI